MNNTPLDVDAAQPPAAGPLTRVVLDIDEYVSGLGWDQPAMLFALVDTERLREEAPGLAERLGLDEEREGAGGGPALTPVEQDEVPPGVPLDEFLATIAWPESVTGCAMTLERLMLPLSVEEAMPEELREGGDEAALGRWVAGHPERREVRLTVAVLRDGQRETAVRLREKDTETEVLTGPGLVPGLAEALSATFEEPAEGLALG